MKVPQFRTVTDRSESIASEQESLERDSRVLTLNSIKYGRGPFGQSFLRKCLKEIQQVRVCAPPAFGSAAR